MQEQCLESLVSAFADAQHPDDQQAPQPQMESMPVPIDSHLDRGVSELGLHCLGMRPLGDQERGAGMAEVVRS